MTGARLPTVLLASFAAFVPLAGRTEAAPSGPSPCARNDVAVQVITEDQVEGWVRRRVMIEEGGVFGVAREFYEEGEDIMDVLR